MGRVTDAKAEQTLAQAARDGPGFILDHGWFITKNELQNDPTNFTLDPLPREEYCYAYLARLFMERLLIVPKTRQMLITWLTAAYLVARLLVARNLLAIYQNKREEDALSFTERCYFLYDHLPAWIQAARPRQRGVKENRYKLEIPSRGNKIWGIPAGPDVIRTNTVSIYVGDEVNFQPEAKASLGAAGPSLGRTGQGIWISTANQGGLVPQLVKGEW